MRIILTVSFFFLSKMVLLAAGIQGTIYSESGDPLPFANVYVKGTTNGTTSNSQGIYALELEAGSYEIVFQYVGYQAKIIKVDVPDRMYTLDVTLQSESIALSQIVVAADAEDPAYRVIREAIKKRKYYRNLLEGYSCDV
ncbi:MAG: carboxypeptidase-like regulatory domain-containing protein, partial [Bacteroidota bacterium]